MTDHGKAILALLGFSELTPEAKFMLTPLAGQPFYATPHLSLANAVRAIGASSFSDYWETMRRRWLLAQIDSAMKSGKTIQRDNQTGQGYLFS